jgi:hypothetical protein
VPFFRTASSTTARPSPAAPPPQETKIKTPQSAKVLGGASAETLETTAGLPAASTLRLSASSAAPNAEEGSEKAWPGEEMVVEFVRFALHCVHFWMFWSIGRPRIFSCSVEQLTHLNKLFWRACM